ncbi:MAG: sigma 54-interacting transcriptional regulator [Lachnospiraceae bacterium]|nr:sigma 54-interacting transcriptional regulator [Lachnospiraceae bacterium]
MDSENRGYDPAFYSLKIDDNNLGIENIVSKCAFLLYQFTIVDKFGTIVYMADNYSRQYGYSAGEVIGKKVEDVIPNTKFYDTLNGKVDINDIFESGNGKALVCSRIPIRNSLNEIIGAISMSGAIDMQPTVNDLYARLSELQHINELYVRQMQGLHKAPSVFDTIVGSSEKITEIKETLMNLVNTRMPILLTGESGVGKEVYANAIYESSDRKGFPFVKVNCAAIPKDLLESEMFGYESGTFTGAIRGGRAGQFERANHGTILLDEVEALSLEMQAKLLRVLQESKVTRLGSSDPIPLNIQVISCTNEDLYEMVEEKKFREDLLYRLNAIEIDIPPLRERMEDLPDLCNSLIGRINSKYDLHILGVSEDALSFLSGYDWPGNIRELEHVIERACIMKNNTYLTREDFQFVKEIWKKHSKKKRKAETEPAPATLFSAREETEKKNIINALTEARGNKTKAAKLLGISRSLFYTKAKKYGIE